MPLSARGLDAPRPPVTARLAPPSRPAGPSRRSGADADIDLRPRAALSPGRPRGPPGLRAHRLPDGLRARDELHRLEPHAHRHQVGRLPELRRPRRRRAGDPRPGQHRAVPRGIPRAHPDSRPGTGAGPQRAGALPHVLSLDRGAAVGAHRGRGRGDVALDADPRHRDRQLRAGRARHQRLVLPEPGGRHGHDDPRRGVAQHRLRDDPGARRPPGHRALPLRGRAHRRRRLLAGPAPHHAAAPRADPAGRHDPAEHPVGEPDRHPARGDRRRPRAHDRDARALHVEGIVLVPPHRLRLGGGDRHVRHQPRR